MSPRCLTRFMVLMVSLCNSLSDSILLLYVRLLKTDSNVMRLEFAFLKCFFIFVARCSQESNSFPSLVVVDWRSRHAVG